MASLISTNPTIWTTVSCSHQRKHQSSALLANCEGNPPVTGGFPSQRDSNVVSVSTSWRHHVWMTLYCISSLKYPASMNVSLAPLWWYRRRHHKENLEVIKPHLYININCYIMCLLLYLDPFPCWSGWPTCWRYPRHHHRHQRCREERRKGEYDLLP